MARNATPSAPHPRVSARKPGGHARERLRAPEIVDRVGSIYEGSADVGGVKSLNWSRRPRVERRGDLRGAASTPAGDSSVGAQCRGRCAEGDVIRILLADDEQLMRTGLRRLLEQVADLEVVAEAVNGEQVLATLPRYRIDVIVLELRMPRMNGLQVLDALSTRSNRPACLVLTTFDDSELLLEAARRGAHGFLSKGVAFEELCNALRALASGASWFQPALTSSLRESFTYRRNGEMTRARDALTDREVEVLRLMAGGLSNREISQTLRTAVGTVKNQVSSILAKMGARDRTLAVLTAIEGGLV